MNILLTDEVESKFTLDYFKNISLATLDATGDDTDSDFEISLLLTDDNVIRELNREYRKKDCATDVLSFPMDEDTMLGDIAISIDTAKRQAQENDINLDREVAFLYIHGLLHLLGYDHEISEDDEKEMFNMQEYILKKLIEKGDIS